MPAHYPIKAVTLSTGLSQHVIRVWEKRYRAVQPVRTATNRRVYTEDDVQKLLWLKKATEAGHSIGQIARFTVDQLKKLTSDSPSFLKMSESMLSVSQDDMIKQYIATALEAVKSLNTEKLTASLKQADLNLNRMTFMEQVITPLMVRIGELWRAGSLKIVHEHFASGIVRHYLGDFRQDSPPITDAPDLVVATPVGHMHEIGAKIVAATAAAEGWHVTYLGPNLPADDIAAAVYLNHSKGVCLSLVYPTDDPRVHGELKKLKSLLPKTLAIFAGGFGANSYVQTLEEIDAIYLDNMLNFRHYLQIYRRHLFV